jgi:hypothetical protein
MSLRKIDAVALEVAPPAWPPSGVDDDGLEAPVIEWGDPTSLYVDETYQRTIGEKGLRLITRVSGGQWSWRKFKLPVVTIAPGGERVLLDGQHTATMAVTRGIRSIPWLLVKTRGQADQADAFVGQNSDRTAVSTLQQHKALVAAGNEEALTIEQVCQRAGVTLCGTQKAVWAENDTIALGSIRKIVNRRYAVGAGRVLRILVAAQLAPISADHIKAVEALLFNAEFKDAVKDERITEALQGASGIKLMDEAKVFAARHRVRTWEGLVSVLYQAATKRRAA